MVFYWSKAIIYKIFYSYFKMISKIIRKIISKINRKKITMYNNKKNKMKNRNANKKKRNANLKENPKRKAKNKTRVTNTNKHSSDYAFVPFTRLWLYPILSMVQVYCTMQCLQYSSTGTNSHLHLGMLIAPDFTTVCSAM